MQDARDDQAATEEVPLTGEQILDAGRPTLSRWLRFAADDPDGGKCNGLETSPGMRLHDGNLRRVLKFAFRDDDNGSYEGSMRAGGFSSISVPGILSNIANKEILSGYLEEDQSWKEISTIKPANEFKQHTSYRMTDNLEYEVVPKGGEITHGTLGEESYTRQVKTYAKMLGLDRVDIVNDDLGAFEDLRVRIGRGSALKFNKIFWTGFLDNSAFFSSGNGNYITGSTTNLGTDGVGLTALVLKFRQLRTSEADGRKRVSGEPTVLLVPPELEFIARKLFVSSSVISGGGSSETVLPSGNVFEGLYRPVIVPYLSDSDYTGYSTTAFYLFRKPQLLAPMAVSFLNGQQTPTVESTEADFNMLGIMFRGYHDFGCDQAEYLSGVKIKGAA